MHMKKLPRLEFRETSEKHIRSEVRRTAKSSFLKYRPIHLSPAGMCESSSLFSDTFSAVTADFELLPVLQRTAFRRPHPAPLPGP